MEELTPPARRQHSEAFKAQVLAECEQPGVSVAAVALAHGLNINLVHKWRRKARRREEDVQRPPATPTARPEPEGFVALPWPPAVAPAPEPPPAEIRIELRRGPVTAIVTWPMSASSDCAAWLREVLR